MEAHASQIFDFLDTEEEDEGVEEDDEVDSHNEDNNDPSGG